MNRFYWATQIGNQLLMWSLIWVIYLIIGNWAGAMILGLISCVIYLNVLYNSPWGQKLLDKFELWLNSL